MDFAARAAQVAGIATAGGDDFTYGDLPFQAIASALKPADAMVYGLGDGSYVALATARDLFSAEFPRIGQQFTDAAGRIYRIQRVEGAPTHPTVRFICGPVTTFSA